MGSGLHFFGVGAGWIPDEIQAKIEAVIPAGVDLIVANIPNASPPGWRHWFESPDRGLPFTRRDEAETWEALAGIGITDLASVVAVE